MILTTAMLTIALANPIPENTTSELDSQHDENIGHINAEAPNYIINGYEASAENFPMTGGMLMRGKILSYPLEMFVCSSTLIAPDTVLLAAHCLDTYAIAWGMEIEDLEIYWTRQENLSNWDGTQQAPELPSDAILAVDWVIHEDFNIETLQIGLSENSDIALLFLSEPILDIEPAYLPTAAEADSITEGDQVFVVGWGQQIATGPQEAPPAGTYAIKQQGESHISLLETYEFKVGEEIDDVRKCHGDSGGPSFWEADDGLRLIGVTSHAYDNTDCFQTGGVDTRIDYYFDWIEENMQSKCDDGTRVWCDEAGIPAPDYFSKQDDEEEDEEEDKGLFSCATASSDLIYYLPLIGFLGLSRRRE